METEKPPSQRGQAQAGGRKFIALLALFFCVPKRFRVRRFNAHDQADLIKHGGNEGNPLALSTG